MVIDERTYTLKPGKVATYMALYEEKGLGPQSRHLGDPVGWFTTDIGTLNQIVHMWGFEDLVDRATRREAMWKDEEWLAFADQAIALIVRMENRILLPAPFSPIR